MLDPLDTKPRSVRFGGFEMDRRTGELLRAGRRLHLTRQAFQLLDLLVSRAGDVVTRDEIRRAMWGDDTFVEFDAAVNACVSQIRFVLGDKATAPRFVETLPRRGYRFVAPVQALAAPQDAHQERYTAAGHVPDDGRPGIAAATARSSTTVIATSIVIVLFTAVAAGFVVVATGGWQPPGEFASVQSLEAIQKLEMGRSGLADAAPADVLDRIHHLTRAVTLEPGFADAYAALADAYLLAAAYRAIDRQRSYAAAKAAAAKALHLNPRLGEAHAFYGAAVLFFEWDWSAAGDHFRRAVSMSSQSPRVHHWYARFLSARGDHRQAVVHAARALTFSPASPSAETYTGVALFYAGDLAKAREHCDRAAELMPEFQPAQICRKAIADPDAAAPAVPEVYLQPTIETARTGDRSQALDRLQVAANRRVDSLIFFALLRGLRPLADEPRFRQLQDRVGPLAHSYRSR